MADKIAAAPIEIQADREIMVHACSLDIDVWRHVQLAFFLDLSFVRDVLTLNPRAVVSLPRASQRAFPDLVKQGMLPFYKSFEMTGLTGETIGFFNYETELQVFVENVAEEFWSDRDFVLAFCGACSPFLGDRFPMEFRSDREIWRVFGQAVQKYGWYD